MKIVSAIVLGVFCAAGLYLQNSNRAKPMISITRTSGRFESEDLAVASVPLRTVPSPTALPRATPPGDDSYPCAYSNLRANSRFVPNLPQGAWKVKWQTPLPAGLAPRLLLWGEQHIVLQGGSAWQLLDATGKPIAHGTYGAANLSLSESRGLLFYINENSYVTGHNLSDGKYRFQELIVTPQAYGHKRLAVSGSRFFVHSVDQDLPHRPTKPNESRLAIYEVTPDYTAGAQFKLIIGTVSTTVAFDDDEVLLATPGMLHSFSADLHLRQSFSGDFEILAMSRDELHRTHAVVQLPNGRRAIWVISDNGERQLEIMIPLECGEVIAPPVIGYDHRIYLVTRGLLAAFSSEGKLLWERGISGYSGGGITLNGCFLASIGNRLVSFGPAGGEIVLHEFKDETSLTQPVITGSGLLLVAGEKNLYGLRQ